jgi:hypothetical protein
MSTKPYTVTWSAETNEDGYIVLTKTEAFRDGGTSSYEFKLEGVDEVDSIRLALLEADRLFAEANEPLPEEYPEPTYEDEPPYSYGPYSGEPPNRPAYGFGE